MGYAKAGRERWESGIRRKTRIREDGVKEVGHRLGVGFLSVSLLV